MKTKDTKGVARIHKSKKDFYFFIFGVLMPLSAIFQLYHGDQF